MGEIQDYLDSEGIVFRPAVRTSLLDRLENSRYNRLFRERRWRKLFNFALAELHRVLGSERVFNMPYFLAFDPTDACQLDCPFCTGGQTPQPHTNSLGAFRSVIEKLGPWLIRAEIYRAGEPLIHPDILEMIRLAKSYGVEVNLSTNLMRLPENSAENLVDSGVDSILVSLDGITQETYAKYRRGGDLNIVLSNLKAVLAARKRPGSPKPRVVWQFLIFKHNQHELRDAVELAKTLGVDQIMFKGGYVPPEPALTEEWKTTLEDIGEFRGCSQDKTCLWPWGGINVNADGGATLCYVDGKSYCRAEDFGRAFRGLWNGEYFRHARRVVTLMQAGKFAPRPQSPFMCEKCHAFGSVNFWI